MSKANGQTNGYAGRDELRKACERKFTEVRVSDVGRYRLRSLNERERSRIDMLVHGDASKPLEERTSEYKARLLAATLVDSEGKLLFTQNKDDLDFLQELNTSVASTIGDAVVKHCGLAEGAVEDAEKN